MNLKSLHNILILAGPILLGGCAASQMHGFENAYQGYSVPEPLVEQIRLYDAPELQHSFVHAEGDLREASLALGATRWQTTMRVVIPAALSGIGTAVMLGMSRAIGETMVVLMVAGGAGIIPTSLLDPVRPMPASIAAEMAEAAFRSEHYHALFAIGIVLFFLTLAFNLAAGALMLKRQTSFAPPVTDNPRGLKLVAETATAAIGSIRSLGLNCYGETSAVYLTRLP